MYRKGKKEDFYTKLAKKEGYPARSIYKLKEIDKKYQIIEKGDKVLDLGSSPGSWLMYSSEIVGDQGLVVGVDEQDIKINKKNILFLKKSIFDINNLEFDYKFNVILSDLAPRTSGLKFLDSGKSLELSEKAFEIAKLFLLNDGNFVCKIFEGELSQEFYKKIKNYFNFSKKVKLNSSSKDSKEFYIIGKGFKK